MKTMDKKITPQSWLKVHYPIEQKLFLKPSLMSYNIMEVSFPPSKLNLMFFLHDD